MADEDMQPEWKPFWRHDLDAVALEYYKKIGLYERLERYEGYYMLVRKVING